MPSEVTDPARKRDWDETQRPAGALFWSVIIAVAVAREVWALATHQTTWTLSAVFWWLAGPRWEWRWWLVWLQVVAFFAWFIVHAGFREFAGGRELVAVCVVALAFSLGAVALSR